MIKKKSYSSFTDEQKKEAYKVLEASNKDPFLKGYFNLSKFNDYISEVIFIETKRDDKKKSFGKKEDFIIIGFYKPRKLTKGKYAGYYRSGPIFILPDFRKKGYAKEALEMYFKDKPGMCWISDRNTASQSLYSSLGFTKTKHKLEDPEDKEMGTFWVKEIE